MSVFPVLVSELSERADVPLATVKYYLREGLLHAGETTGPRRSEYDERHLRRLRVLRLLREVGEVPVTSLCQIVDALDDEEMPVHDAMAQIARLRAQVESLMRDRVAPAVGDAAGRVEAAAYDAADVMRGRADDIAVAVRDRPLAAVCVAAVVGFLLGRMGR